MAADAILTIALWVHCILNAGTVMEGAHVENQLWRELRGSLAVMITAAPWIALEVLT